MANIFDLLEDVKALRKAKHHSWKERDRMWLRSQTLKFVKPRRNKRRKLLKERTKAYLRHTKSYIEHRKIKSALEQAEHIFQDACKQILVKAGVPKKHLDNMKVEESSDGAIEILFGGKYKPANGKHGHYVIKRNGRVHYMRDRWDKHGTHNYVDSPLFCKKKALRVQKLEFVLQESLSV